MNKYFGTDGFRGKVGTELTALHAFKIGRFLGHYLSENRAKDSNKPRVVIGKDTRLSSYALEYGIASGLTASGTDVFLMHVITTPGLTHLTLEDNFDLGIMITASHNPYYDNGIKIINSDGEKIDDSLASKIEEYLDSDERTYPLPFSAGSDIGKIESYLEGREKYVHHLTSLAGISLAGLKVGLDSANGAAFDLSRTIFDSLGAEVHCIGNTPDGININEGCGSTHIESLSRLVKEKELDVGFAFDGDGDRCIAVDKGGNIVDGDSIIYILAKRFLRQGLMKNKTVVTTVMSNGGLLKSLSNLGVHTEITKVGDRFVYERMQKTKSILGGEQSGHIIMKKFATTGDGLLTAITLSREICELGRPLGELKDGLIVYPQESISVSVNNKSIVINDEKLSALTERIKTELLPNGRLLIRESGTEPKIRIMVEAENENICESCISKILSLLKERGYING